MSDRTGREDCYICGHGNADILEQHHIVPQRHGGSDSAENLVELCPSCHETLERLYNKRFYDVLEGKLNGERLDEDNPGGFHDEECSRRGCRSEETYKLLGSEGLEPVFLCEAHSACAHESCGTQSYNYVLADGMYGKFLPVCNDHYNCAAYKYAGFGKPNMDKCESDPHSYIETVNGEKSVLCEKHMRFYRVGGVVDGGAFRE